MDQSMTKATLLEAFRRSREDLETLLSRFDDEQMLRPGVEATWSLKELMWHIVAWEMGLCRWLAAAVTGEEPTDFPRTDADVDQMNATFDVEGQRLSLAEVQQAFAGAYSQVAEAILAVPEADLLDPARFAWRQGQPLWHMVGGNTFWHYQEHAETIRAWLVQQA